MHVGRQQMMAQMLWAPATYMGDLDEDLAPGFNLTRDLAISVI